MPEPCSKRNSAAEYRPVELLLLAVKLAWVHARYSQTRLLTQTTKSRVRARGVRHWQGLKGQMGRRAHCQTSLGNRRSGTDLGGPFLLCDMAMQMVMGFKATILTSTERCVAMQKSAKEMECAVVSKPPMMNVPISARSCGSSSALPVDHRRNAVAWCRS